MVLHTFHISYLEGIGRRSMVQYWPLAKSIKPQLRNN
jgi:hypothetical protein